MRRMRRWRAACFFTGVAVAGLGLLSSSAMADGPATDVWLDVVKVADLSRISVTVPVAYGFAVVGSVDTSDATPISAVDGTLLLPNVRVAVKDSGGSNRDYELQFLGEQYMPIRNYSTDLADYDSRDEFGGRIGLAVKLKASIDQNDDGGTLIPDPLRAYWRTSAAAPGTGTEDFKKYRISLDGQPFSVEQAETPGVYHMEGEILIPAPEDVENNGWTAGGIANIPMERYVPVEVEVGGQKGQYSQVEQSVKVSAIRWKVEAVPVPEP